MSMDKTPSFELPGFRFHPTEEELIDFYLKNMIHDRKMHLDIIGFLNIYRFDPWDLPGLAKIGEREWYFFVPRDRKHNNGGRPNRTTENGFWKATGSDRKIVSLSEPKRAIGLRKTLVFYQGRAPRGTKTDWIMNEYRLPDNYPLPKDIVLCKIYRKATSLKELEQRAAKEEEKSLMTFYPTSPISSTNENHSIIGGYFSGTSASGQLQDLLPSTMQIISTLKREDNLLNSSYNNNNHNVGVASSYSTSNSIQLPFGKESIELQVTKSGMGTSTDIGTGMDWDSLCSLSFSPWIENLFNFSSPTLISQIL